MVCAPRDVAASPRCDARARYAPSRLTRGCHPEPAVRTRSPHLAAAADRMGEGPEAWPPHARDRLRSALPGGRKKISQLTRRVQNFVEFFILKLVNKGNVIFYSFQRNSDLGGSPRSGRGGRPG